jgi:hypothetical protein
MNEWGRIVGLRSLFLREEFVDFSAFYRVCTGRLLRVDNDHINASRLQSVCQLAYVIFVLVQSKLDPETGV